jgi:hypothetical protein
MKPSWRTPVCRVCLAKPETNACARPRKAGQQENPQADPTDQWESVSSDDLPGSSLCPAKRGPAHSNNVSGIRQKTWHTSSTRERPLAGVAGSALLRARTADEDFHAGRGAFSRKT